MRSLGRTDAAGRHRRGRPVATTPDNYGYPKASLADASGARRVVYLHRAVAAAWCPNDDPAARTEVDHVNGDHSDARAANQEWVTPDENKRRAREVLRGEMARRLTPAEVEAVRASRGRPCDVAAALGVTCAAVTDIRRGRSHRAAPGKGKR